jgi:hypothetical protein
MTLEKLFERLSYGVFSNQEIGMQGTGAISEADRPKVTFHVNEGLIRLYNRFILKEKQVIIQQYDGITNYWLLERYSESRAPQPGVTYPYIKDLNREQFVDDVVKILSVYQDGQALPINDADLVNSVFTPQAKLLQVPFAKNGHYMGIGYQAKHPEMSADRLQDMIELPEVLWGALEAYVAGRVYSSIGTPDARNSVAEQMGIYDNICNEVQASDAVSSSISTTPVSRFKKGGWV